MRRPGQEGGGSGAHSVVGVLGLRHADGSPVTLEDCRTWAEVARKEKSRAASDLHAALGQEADPFERAALVEVMWFSHLRLLAWKALERLARFTLERDA